MAFLVQNPAINIKGKFLTHMLIRFLIFFPPFQMHTNRSGRKEIEKVYMDTESGLTNL